LILVDLDHYVCIHGYIETLIIAIVIDSAFHIEMAYSFCVVLVLPYI